MARRTSSSRAWAIAATLLACVLLYVFSASPTSSSPFLNPKSTADRALQHLDDSPGLEFNERKPLAVEQDWRIKPAPHEDVLHPVLAGPPTAEGAKGPARGRVAAAGQGNPLKRPALIEMNLPLPAVRITGTDESEEALDKATLGLLDPIVLYSPEEELGDVDLEVVDVPLPAAKGVIGGAVIGGKRLPPAPARPDTKKPGKWTGGWSDRFKAKPVDGTARAPPVTGVLAHPLVARMLDYDFTPMGLPAAPAPPPPPPPASDDDAFQAQPAGPVIPPPKKLEYKPPTKFNVTLCAVSTGELKFLPEWLVYHRLLGVERFVLYDTSFAGAAGGAELDGGADLIEAKGRGEMAPSVDELKAGMGTSNGGLDEKGQLWAERIVGLEKWIEQGVVVLNWMRFKNAKKAASFHQLMAADCEANFAASSEWLAHIDIDEFLVLSPTLYSPVSPYQDAPIIASTPFRYPLHDLLARPANKDSACIPIPQLKFRNVGVRNLASGQGVLETHVNRDAADHDLDEKALIHPSFSSPSLVHFEGPHSCFIDPAGDVPAGLSNEIRNSQGALLQVGGSYTSTRLPIEPLAIAHYPQRDHSDCYQKLAILDDPNNSNQEGTSGQILCDESYLPSAEERADPSWLSTPQNRFLARLPTGAVVEDQRVKTSWAGETTRSILAAWRKDTSGKGGSTEKEVQRARHKVRMLDF